LSTTPPELLVGRNSLWDAGFRGREVAMAITEHDRKVGALLGLDPARIAENRRKAEEESVARGTQPFSKERVREFTAFSDEVSDEEFERYMAYIYAERGWTA
jgi:hypothetical protein